MADTSQNSISQLLHIPAVHKQYYGIFGNLPDIDPTNMTTSLWRLADLYGPIYSLELGGKKSIVISSYDLMQDASNDERFRKAVDGALVLVRDSVGDGLFTAYWNEPVWSVSKDGLKTFLIVIELGQSTPYSDACVRTNCRSKNVRSTTRHRFTDNPQVG